MIFLFCGSLAVEIGDPMGDIFWIPDVRLRLKAKIPTQRCGRDKVKKLQRHPSVSASKYQVAGEYEFSHDPFWPPEFSTN